MSYKQGDEIHIEDDDASAGEKTGHMRWVLGISLFIAVAVMSAVWIIPALMQGDTEEEIVMSEQPETASDDGVVPQEEDGAETGDTDGIVSGEDETFEGSE